jgi:hypothetical protein
MYDIGVTTTLDPVSDPRARRRDPLVTAVAGLVFVLAGALGGIRYAGATPAEGGAERVLASVALAAVAGLPAVLAVLARSRRPSLLVAAGAGLAPLSLVAMSGATLPLIVPAALLLVAGAQRSGGDATEPCAPVPVTTALVVVAMIGAALALFAHQDARTWGGPAAGGSTSDVVTLPESLAALGIVSLTAVVAWYLATPVVRGRPRPER